MRTIAFVTAAGVFALLLTGCSGKSGSTEEKNAAQTTPAAPAIPADVQTAAQSSLGSEAEVLLYGDLALNGHQQALAVNRLKVTPPGVAPGILVTRAVIIESEAGKWKEIFRCDEHLQNASGFLGGTPLSPVSGWRVRYEQDPQKGLAMYFTPIAKPAGGYLITIGVRWNPKLKRYQALDRNFQEFVGETKQLETPQSQISQ
jgi:hypothetical protein